MKFNLSICLVAIVALLTFGISGTSNAFHEGGVAHCDGCHSMHQSPDNPISGAANTTLLKGSDASSTCLNCHNGSGGYHIASPDGFNTNAGGDFYWVTRGTYDVNVRGTLYPFGGDNAGHNVIALDFAGFTLDATNAAAPGGTFPSDAMACTSCHDPHGQVQGGTRSGTGPVTVSGSYGASVPAAPGVLGNYRLLGDSVFEAVDGVASTYPFTDDAPIATASGSNGASVDYGSGMSEWCGNCHADYAAGDLTMHQAGFNAGQGLLDGATWDYTSSYNSYVQTGDFTGVQASSYDPLVSFERGIGVLGDALDEASTAGPVAAGPEQVMCLTCHRAHASAHNNIGRWDFETELLAESHAIESADIDPTAAIYYKNGNVIDVAVEYGASQRSLCNKCHVQD